ncbi:MAG: energy transducer TonB [Acidobacteria bacterium]|nr:energy transducer TonB [Acidobacteriota bacterium]
MQLTRHTSLLLVLLACLCPLCPAQDGKATNNNPPPQAIGSNPDRWETFLPPDGSCSVLMPGKPVALTREGEANGKKYPINLYILITGAAHYVLTTTDYPDMQIPDEAQFRKIHDGMVERLLKDNKNRLLNERDVKVEGQQVRDLLMANGDDIVRNRFVIAGKRIYQLMLIVPRTVAFKTGEPSSNLADLTDFYQMISAKFFDSFHLLSGGPASTPKTTGGEQQGMISSGVLNGKAIKLPRPDYPSAAKSAGIEGTVFVHVVIGEEGKVLEAKAVSGNPMLRAEAEKAARQARFSVVKLQGTPVKVEGFIEYVFSLH